MMADPETMNPVSNPVVNPQLQVLAMTMSDVRTTIAQTAAAPQKQPADVILELSTAAQQLLGR